MSVEPLVKTSVNAAPISPARRGFAAIVSLVFLALALARVVRHVMWRDEVRAWQLVRSASSLRELRAAAYYDGHPVLWSLTLWPLSRFTGDVRAMQLVHVLIASGAVWILARFAPWRRWQIVLVLLGYFVFFEYTIVSRDYAWGMLFFFGALATFDRSRDPRRYRFAFCCAGAIQSNPFAVLLVGALALTALIDDVLCGRREQRHARLTNFAWIALPIASAVFALWAMLPGPSARYTIPYDGSAPFRRLSVVFAGVGRALVPIPAPVDGWWNTAILSLDIETARQHLGLYHTLSALAGLILIGLTLLFRNRRTAFVFLISSVGLISAFSFFEFAGSMRHNGHFVLALLGAWWLASNGTFTTSPHAKLDRRRDAALVCFFALQAIAGVVASYRDLVEPFSAAPAAAAWIHEHGRGLRLIGNPDYAAVPVAAILGAPFFSPDSFDFVTFNTQGPLSPEMPSMSDEPTVLAAILRKTGDREMVLIRSGLITPRPGESFGFDVADPDGRSGQHQLVMTSLAEFPVSANPSEQYTIILVRLVPAPEPLPQTPSVHD